MFENIFKMLSFRFFTIQIGQCYLEFLPHFKLSNNFHFLVNLFSFFLFAVVQKIYENKVALMSLPICCKTFLYKLYNPHVSSKGDNYAGFHFDSIIQAKLPLRPILGIVITILKFRPIPQCKTKQKKEIRISILSYVLCFLKRVLKLFPKPSSHFSLFYTTKV